MYKPKHNSLKSHLTTTRFSINFSLILELIKTKRELILLLEILANRYYTQYLIIIIINNLKYRVIKASVSNIINTNVFSIRGGWAKIKRGFKKKKKIKSWSFMYIKKKKKE